MDEFIKKIILGVSIQAAFQRGNIYASPTLRDKDRKELKNSIKEELQKISRDYINTISEKKHIENIKLLSKAITKKHKEKLKKNKLRIGSAQKLLNVYLKFLWRLGEIEEPPHCPIDRIVLKEIKDDSNWTDLDSIKKYNRIISKIRGRFHNKTQTLAKWELELWNKKA